MGVSPLGQLRQTGLSAIDQYHLHPGPHPVDQYLVIGHRGVDERHLLAPLVLAWIHATHLDQCRVNLGGGCDALGGVARGVVPNIRRGGIMGGIVPGIDQRGHRRAVEHQPRLQSQTTRQKETILHDFSRQTPFLLAVSSRKQRGNLKYGCLMKTWIEGATHPSQPSSLPRSCCQSSSTKPSLHTRHARGDLRQGAQAGQPAGKQKFVHGITSPARCQGQSILWNDKQSENDIHNKYYKHRPERQAMQANTSTIHDQYMKYDFLEC
ncbi:hypothetical protein [Candidatus Magnetaquiglobus chichijimensis]|uniref:hypothetical protein n=1 Tax=Candidatus Magnetaquiglobus chichijimensis TaxID=3141448 RepID=UPI003B97C026